MSFDRDSTQSTLEWYQKSYEEGGLVAQRRYPNEELLRFFGRRLFPIPHDQRGSTHVLELGSGSCGNLWMVAREGFAAHGIDLAPQAVELGTRMMDFWGTSAELLTGSMDDLPWPDQSFQVVFDVFSSNCLDAASFARCLKEVSRVLKTGGRYFTYTPSKRSDDFLNPGPSLMIDSSTLDGIRRADAVFAGNHYPFRFVHPLELAEKLREVDLTVEYSETLGRTYGCGRDYFEFVIVEASKS
jgi:SAM-dependent methyltransferase